MRIWLPNGSRRPRFLSSTARLTGRESSTGSASFPPNRQRMPEHIPRVPPRLDPLQARVVFLVVERGPGHARGIQRRVREISVGMIDERSAVRLARDRNASGLREEIPIEQPDP